MKKLTAILLLIVYATASFGLGVKQFYCCGKLKSRSFVFSQDAKEKSNRGNKREGCCKNEYLTFKVKDNYVAIKDFANQGKPLAHLRTFTPFYHSFDYPRLQQINTESNPDNAPPLHYGVPVYVLNCTYRI